MKKIILTSAILLFTTPFCFAESVKDEAIDSLATAQSFVKDGNFNKALEEINYAMAKINELTAEQLLQFIPEPPEGFTLINKQSQGVGAGASIAGTAGANGEYSHVDGGNIKLNIAIGGMTGKMASLAALGSMFAGLAQDASGGQTKKIRVQGYTGTQIFNSNEQTGTLTFQVGDKTSVTLEGSSISSIDTLMQLAKKFNFSDLEKNF